MRIINETKTIKLPEASSYRFFIQMWYSLVHRNSLDSHRVRCMNSLNILRELKGLILKEDLPNIFEDIKRGSEETLYILSRDRIVSKYFNHNLDYIKPLLEEIIKEPPAKEKKTMQSVIVLSYYVKDFISVLQREYKTKILYELEKAIFESRTEEDISEYTGTLLSVLIDEGHSIEELFGIVQNIFIENKSSKTFMFADNFQFIKRIIVHPDYSYEIVFRIEGCKKYDLLPSNILNIKFEKEPIIESSDDLVKSFLSPGQNIIFARVLTSAQDDRSAGMFAKKRLDEILDLIRFELEHELIDVGREFASIRPDKSTARIFKLPSEIPNPNKNITAEEFKQFVKRTTDIFEASSIDRESREKIKSAIRFYRMGRDSEQFENKYLNWWTALEYLLRSGKGSIVDEIENKLRAVLVLNYIPKHLDSYKSTLSFCKVKPTKEACEKNEIKDYTEIGNFAFLELLRDQKEIESIKKQLNGYPAVRFRVEKIEKRIKDAKTLLAFLNIHEKNVSWHIHRIWRIRCDIVHSAEYSLNLILLSANLEYYLKYLLTIILSSLTDNMTINSLDELFTRMDYSYKRLKTELDAGSLNFCNELLKGNIL